MKQRSKLLKIKFFLSAEEMTQAASMTLVAINAYLN